MRFFFFSVFFFFNDTATTEIYTLSLHDALPILALAPYAHSSRSLCHCCAPRSSPRSEEHTSELLSRSDLVCRLLLEKKKQKQTTCTTRIPVYSGYRQDIMCIHY